MDTVLVPCPRLETVPNAGRYVSNSEEVDGFNRDAGRNDLPHILSNLPWKITLLNRAGKCYRPFGHETNKGRTLERILQQVRAECFCVSTLIPKPATGPVAGRMLLAMRFR